MLPVLQAGHQHHIQHKSRVAVSGRQAPGTKKKYHRRMYQSVKRVHSQKAGGNNGIVDDGLKHDGCSPNTEGGYQHNNKLGFPKAHCILEISQIYIHA